MITPAQAKAIVKAGIKAVANVPSREELLSKLLGSLQSPITNFARVMNQLAEKGGASACEAPAAEAAPAEEAAIDFLSAFSYQLNFLQM